MATLIYVMCAATAALCAVLLLRGWQRTRTGLLFWSGLCFAGLAASNVILALDRLVFTHTDLTIPRLVAALVALLLLLFGLIWESD